MEKKVYSRPIVLNHELVQFETLLSCNPPNSPAVTATGKQVCLKPDLTWFER
ncbi:hypothetical protein [Paenibacillus hamazuiensis]|uniref:hypothetical protein n=1 Tax=Paenibacillus hamazuiensis TaxID=2936508 RepID=UPI0020104C7A|nr:hypothetical protein [Paenibacillus hamazuiensis]